MRARIARAMKCLLAILALMFAIVPLRAPASPAQLGLDVVFVNGTHHESHGDVRASGVPAPMLRLTKDSGRFEFFVEGIPPMGGIPVSGTSLGVNSVQLTYLDMAARYRVLPATLVGIGETIYNQQTGYTSVFHGFNFTDTTIETDRSRVVGLELGVLQTLRQTPRSIAELSVAANPYMQGTLGMKFDEMSSDGGSFHGPWVDVPESGSQIQAMLVNSVAERRTVFRYGVRYLNLTMHFTDGTLADHNAFFIPFFGGTFAIGK